MKNGRDHQGTPQGAFNWANRIFGPFDLDVAASEWNAKCPRFYTEIQNGLRLPWTGRVWCNPPWQEIEPWVERALSLMRGEDGPDLVCFLLPVRGSRRWYVELERSGAWRVPIYPGRLKFDPPPGEEKGSGGFEDCCFWILVRPPCAADLQRGSVLASIVETANIVEINRHG